MKFINKIFLLALGAYSFGIAQAQVTLNRSIEFTGNGDSARVVNLKALNDTTGGLNAEATQSNGFLYAMASGINSISLVTKANLVSPSRGMILYFKASAQNTASVFLSINGSTFYELKKQQNVSLASGDILNGQIVATAFDGTNFQFLNFENLECPSGFIAVTSEYCIETNESIVADSFYVAIVNCYTKNARLCNWGEWYNACVSLGTSLSNMTNNWEYTDDAGNEVNYVRIVGSGSCTAAGNQNIPLNAPKKHRCCYSRK